MKLTGLLFAAALLGSCTQPAAEENYTRHVDPKIGTGGHGHVFVGANVPFGLVQVGPTSIPQTWDWCSGYHASDSTVIGFFVKIPFSQKFFQCHLRKTINI